MKAYLDIYSFLFKSLNKSLKIRDQELAVNLQVNLSKFLLPLGNISLSLTHEKLRPWKYQVESTGLHLWLAMNDSREGKVLALVSYKCA